MKNFEKFAIETAKKAGELLNDNFKKNGALLRATSKGAKSIYDKLVDEVIIKSIEKNLPAHSYVTEENGSVDKGGDYLWIIDPVDGTSNFENHNPFFSVSIALMYKNKPLLGVIEAPALGERYVAILGKGAYIEDFNKKIKKKAKVSDVNKIGSSYWVFCEGGAKRPERTVKLFKAIRPKTKEFRKLGSAALELAWVGAGRAEGYITTGISLWDIAAGMLFVSEAGGRISRFNGEKYEWKDFNHNNSYDIVATNGKLKINF